MNMLTGVGLIIAFLAILAVGLSIMLLTYFSSLYLYPFLRRSRLSRTHIFCIALMAWITIFASCVAFAAIMGGSVLPDISTSEFISAIINGVFIWMTLFFCLLIALPVFRAVAGLVYFIREFLKSE